MASADAVKESLKMLLAAFPSAKFDLATAGTWQKLLVDLSDESVLGAAQDIAKTGDWFPSLPEFRRAAAAWGPDQAGKGNLTRMRMKLERDAAAGDFDPAAWERLANDFEDAGRPAGAESIRRRAICFREKRGPHESDVYLKAASAAEDAKALDSV